MKPLGAITEFGIRQVPAPNERTVVPILAHISEVQHFRIGKSVLITREGDLTITRCDMESDHTRVWSSTTQVICREDSPEYECGKLVSGLRRQRILHTRLGHNRL
jgi:hypothetical protein